MDTTSPRAEGPPDGYGPFAHLTAPNVLLYRSVMRAFLVAKERFAVHLRPEDVYAGPASAARPAELDAVVKALDSLVGWGNLRADPDTGRVTAVEDFYRKRFIYQLTREGEAAEEALSAYDEALGRRGALQAVALHDIVTQLRALLVLAAEEEPDPAKHIWRWTGWPVASARSPTMRGPSWDPSSGPSTSTTWGRRCSSPTRTSSSSTWSASSRT